MLTPLPSLDSVLAIVTSTPPIPTFAYSTGTGKQSPFIGQVPSDSAYGFYTSDPQFSDHQPGSSGVVKEDVWIGAESTSPASPFTCVTTQRCLELIISA